VDITDAFVLERRHDSDLGFVAEDASEHHGKEQQARSMGGGSYYETRFIIITHFPPLTKIK